MQRTIALCLLLAATLAACQRAPSPANTVAPMSAATASASPAPPATAPSESPTHFVTRLLAPYQPNGREWANTGTAAASDAQDAWQKSYDAEFYDPDFLKIINDNAMLAADKSGGMDIDYDPLCQCQGAGPNFSVVSARPDGARYDVAVDSDEKAQGTWTFVLSPSGATWRVYDVVASTGSTRAMLTQHNACLRAAKDETAGAKCVSS
jgi:hypothetical protein